MRGCTSRYVAQAVGLAALGAVLAGCATTPAGGGATPSRGLTASPQPRAPTATPTQLPTPTAQVAVATAPLPTSVATEAAEYTVQGGDTLLGLAADWGVPMAAIQRANGLGGSTVLMAGDTLRVPSADGWETASRYWVLHIVRDGETLSHIARRFELDLVRLQEVNELADANQIRVGQEIVLPLDTLAMYVEEQPTETPVPPLPTQVVTATGEAGAPPAPAATVAYVPDAAPPPADIADWPLETVRIINVIRAEHGLPPYTYNDTLAAAAQAHANDCVQRGWCSHTGSDGADIKTRVRRAGYQGSGWAECWAQRQSPQGAVDIWMDEVPPDDAHRRMMLHTWFTEVGVGVAKAPWGYYFIADFGRP